MPLIGRGAAIPTRWLSDSLSSSGSVNVVSMKACGMQQCMRHTGKTRVPFHKSSPSYVSGLPWTQRKPRQDPTCTDRKSMPTLRLFTDWRGNGYEPVFPQPSRDLIVSLPGHTGFCRRSLSCAREYPEIFGNIRAEKVSWHLTAVILQDMLLFLEYEN